MGFKLHGTWHGKPEAQLPQNRGMSSVAQRKIDETVGIANRKTMEAIKTDGRPVRVWNYNLRGSIPCTCSYHAGMSDRITAGGKNEFGIGKAKIDQSNFELQPSTSPDEDSPDSFVVRGSGYSRSKDHFVNQPLASKDRAIGKAQLDGGDGGEDNSTPYVNQGFDEEPGVIDLSALANNFAGGERKQCGICYGTGFVDGYLYVGGQRIVLDNNPQQNSTINAVEVATGEFPNAFRMNNTKQWIMWDLMLPTYFDSVPELVKIKDNHRMVTGFIPEVRIVNDLNDATETDLDWHTLTPHWLMERNGRRNHVQIRVRTDHNTLEGAGQQFTHLEFLIQGMRLPWAQLPQITKSTSYEHIDYMAALPCELEPTLPPLNRETVIEDTTTGELWKVVDIMNKKTAKNQFFGFEMTVRRIQEVEQVWGLRYGAHHIPSLPFRGIERKQGGIS